MEAQIHGHPRAFTAFTHKVLKTDNSVNKKLILLFLNRNVCCGYSMRIGSVEYQKHFFHLMYRKIINYETGLSPPVKYFY